jgi:hypothetical protein
LSPRYCSSSDPTVRQGQGKENRPMAMPSDDTTTQPAGSTTTAATRPPPDPAEAATLPAEEEIGGPAGPDPTRFGDWERKGRCIDF